MNTEVQDLISQANTIVADIAQRGKRRRYPAQLKAIVRALARQHKLSCTQIIAAIPVSRTAVQQWTLQFLFVDYTMCHLVNVCS